MGYLLLASVEFLMPALALATDACESSYISRCEAINLALKAHCEPAVETSMFQYVSIVISEWLPPSAGAACPFPLSGIQALHAFR